MDVFLPANTNRTEKLSVRDDFVETAGRMMNPRVDPVNRLIGRIRVVILIFFKQGAERRDLQFK